MTQPALSVVTPVRASRNSGVTYTAADLVTLGLIGGVFAAWLSVAAGTFSVAGLVACEAACFLYYVIGSLVASRRSLRAGILFDLPLRLLVGYGVVNTAMLALAWISPLPIVANFGLLFALATWLFFAASEREQKRTNIAVSLAVGLCVVATTLWCQDSLRPSSQLDGQVLFKPWIDSFYHAVHIRIFSAGHGAASIEDFRLVGLPARPYHYGMYLLPAFVKQASGSASYAVFAGILAPVGVFFTGLAAYAFFGSLWGRWSGVSAAAALLLLPDGAQQGMRNTFMSYHWLTQISPSASYGLALLAVAWLFVLKGSVQGSRLQVLFGLVVACVVSVYKLHYVIASAPLLLLVPAMFFRARVTRQTRASLVLGACGVCALAFALVQRVPGVPLIRFDGSCVGELMRLVQTFAAPGVIRDFVVNHTGAQRSNASNLLFGVPYIFLSILGLFLPLLAVSVINMRRRMPRLYLLFPLLLSLNFALMFFGLALDFDSSTPDELSHRPLMIVYFFVTAWTGGALALLLSQSRRLARSAPALAGLAAFALAVPARFGPGVQSLWAMPDLAPVRVPYALLQVADYIRSHGRADDVFQDSQFDRYYVLAALSERRTFVGHTLGRMPFRTEVIETRTAAIDRFMGLRQPKLVVATARVLGFRWFVLERGDRVDWPQEIALHPVLEAGPFKLYEF